MDWIADLTHNNYVDCPRKYGCAVDTSAVEEETWKYS